jgi:hypothetical protein
VCLDIGPRQGSSTRTQVVPYSGIGRGAVRYKLAMLLRQLGKVFQGMTIWKICNSMLRCCCYFTLLYKCFFKSQTPKDHHPNHLLDNSVVILFRSAEAPPSPLITLLFSIALLPRKGKTSPRLPYAIYYLSATAIDGTGGDGTGWDIL